MKGKAIVYALTDLKRFHVVKHNLVANAGLSQEGSLVLPPTSLPLSLLIPPQQICRKSLGGLYMISGGTPTPPLDPPCTEVQIYLFSLMIIFNFKLDISIFATKLPLTGRIRGEMHGNVSRGIALIPGCPPSWKKN